MAGMTARLARFAAGRVRAQQMRADEAPAPDAEARAGQAAPADPPADPPAGGDGGRPPGPQGGGKGRRRHPWRNRAIKLGVAGAVAAIVVPRLTQDDQGENAPQGPTETLTVHEEGIASPAPDFVTSGHGRVYVEELGLVAFTRQGYEIDVEGVPARHAFYGTRDTVERMADLAAPKRVSVEAAEDGSRLRQRAFVDDQGHLDIVYHFDTDQIALNWVREQGQDAHALPVRALSEDGQDYFREMEGRYGAETYQNDDASEAKPEIPRIDRGGRGQRQGFEPLPPPPGPGKGQS